jgi:sRNA-binding protein
MRFALGADYPVSALVRHRYRRVADLTGTDLGRLGRERVSHANARVERALAGRFERDLRSRYDSPAAAARTARVGEVRIVVRRWSA